MTNSNEMKFGQMVRQAALDAGISPIIFFNQIRQESGYNPSIVSHAGAEGIAQIMPATAKDWGVNPMDPKAALHCAAIHMAAYLHRYKGSYEKALAAYNAGPGSVDSGAWLKYPETVNYVHTILHG